MTENYSIKKNRKYNNDKINLILFFIWPFFSFLVSVFNFRDKRQRKYILFYFILFGLTAVYSKNTHDAFSHVEYFYQIAKKPLSDFWVIMSNVFSARDNNLTDLYATLVNFFVSRFTESPSFMFGFHALIFGAFYLKSVGVLYDEFQGNKNINALLFLFLFVSIIPIDKIQYVRFWTAAWIYIYAVLKLLHKKNRTDFILLFLTILIHASYMLPVMLVMVYFIIGAKPNIYFIILGFSIFLPNLLEDQIRTLSFLQESEIFNSKIKAYSLNELYVAQRETRFLTKAWYVRFQVPAFFYTIVFLLSYIYIKRRKFIFDHFQKILFCFSILFLSFVNFGNEIASLGERFVLLFFVFALAFLYRHFSLNNVKSVHFLSYLMILPGLLWVVVQLRFMFDFMNAFMLIGSPFVFLFDETNITFF